MESLVRYRGREVNTDEVAFIRKLIADEPGASRRALSQKICEAWGWVQANGAARDAVCRGFYAVLASDCVASHTPPLHEATLKNVQFLFGDVVDRETIAAAWSSARQKA